MRYANIDDYDNGQLWHRELLMTNIPLSETSKIIMDGLSLSKAVWNQQNIHLS